jgi:hypothetical protein
MFSPRAAAITPKATALSAAMKNHKTFFRVGTGRVIPTGLAREN